MRSPEDIIISPVVTEESMSHIHDEGGNAKYTFKVNKKSNKIEIKRAAEKLFGITVKKVNTMNVRGPKRTVGTNSGYKPDWKKAIVTITADSKKIDFFESMV